MNRTLKVSGLISLILISMGMTLWFAVQPPRYRPDYTISALKGLQPAKAIRTPWRTILVYKVPGPPHAIGPRIVAEVQKQRPNWKLSRRQGMYQLEDPRVKDTRRREGIHIMAGTSADATYIQVVSPVYNPNALQKWWSNVVVDRG